MLSAAEFEKKKEERLTRWDFFQKHHWVSPLFSHSPILASWERCAKVCNPYQWEKPNIARGATLNSFQNRNSMITAMAETVLEDAYQMMASRQCCFVVTDESGCTLSIIGSADLQAKLYEMGIKKGAFWSEGKLGTNAISLCLHTNECVTLLGADHFNLALHGFSCHAAPVFNDLGSVKAAVMLISNVASHNPNDLSLIDVCAKNIASQITIEKSNIDYNEIISQRNAVLECMADGVISWDKDDKITFVNQVALDKLQLDKHNSYNKSFNDIILLPPLLRRCIESREKISLVDGVIEVKGEFVESLMTLKPLNDGGCILLMHPVETFRKLAHQQLGSNVQLSFDTLIAHSKKMKQVVGLAKRAAKVKSPILLRGENGVGKGQIAMAIHNHSQFSAGPFITINCKSLASSNMLTTIFGTDDGEGIVSKLELASKGTLYLEEIEHLSSEAQSLLLQVLKTNLLVRVNSNRMIPVNFQLITSTTSDLEQYVVKHSFRRQLYYTIGAVELVVPPLRQRQEDIPEYINRLIDRMKQRFGGNVTISDDAQQVFTHYSWPGNIPELQNKIEKIMLNRQGDSIGINDIPADLLRPSQSAEGVHQDSNVMSLEDIERRAILDAWKLFDGRANDIAAALKIGRTTLWRKLKKYGVTEDTDVA